MPNIEPSTSAETFTQSEEVQDIVDLDLNLLKALHALLQEQHVGLAAQSLRITPSAMSHSLRKLREIFDDPLLMRVSNHMELSELGQDLKSKVKTLVSDIIAIAASSQFSPSRINKVFRIDVYEFVVTKYLAEPFRKLRELAPNLILEINPFTGESPDKLNDGKIDLAIGPKNFAKANLMCRSFCEERLVCVMRKDHPALGNWSPEAFYNYPQVAPGHQNVIRNGGRVRAFARKNGFTIIQGLLTGSPQMILSLLPDTDIIGMMLTGNLEVFSLGDKLTSMELPFDGGKTEINMLWNERRHNDADHRWIRNQLLS